MSEETQVDPVETETVETDSGARTEPETVVDEFKPITSQADFDARLKDRLDRANKSAQKKFDAQIKDLSEKLKAFEDEKLTDAQKKDKRLDEITNALAERDKTIAQFERERLVGDVASELGLPRKFWDRVRGEDEDAIRQDIASLLEDLPTKPVNAPPHNSTVRVQSTGDDGEPELTAEAILEGISPRARGY
ncbi:DUF4355 domain-containing protein [Mycobacteroides chelonae]|nr:DUF4355 domain-containing protein [Mycobacteroides chelonae]